MRPGTIWCLPRSIRKIGSRGRPTVSSRRGFQAGKGRPVRWDAARAQLLAVLDGTSPYVFRTVLDVLAATASETTLAKELIREAPDLLLAHVGARHEITRQPAIDLLKAVSGEDFGADREAWAEWLDSPLDDS